MWTVYLIYDADDKLIYVGCTSNIKKRMNQHRTERYWANEIAKVEIENWPTKAEGFKREGYLVKTLRPRYNHRISTGESIGKNPNFVQIIARVPKTLKDQIRKEAQEEDRSMNQVITTALKYYFNAPKGQGPRKKRKRTE